ncbi:hypothetical protein AGMMS50249_4440 [candidate division SR1 bacterium]|nr:hypothetical protein AGMMS50249_4440 [candidate division SR1 bacterium]
MKDWIKRIVVISIFGAFLAYLGFCLFMYLSTGGEIALMKAGYENLTISVFAVLILMCVYLIVFYGAYPVHFRFSRTALLFLSIALIVCSQEMFENSGLEHVYMGDIFSVLGVLILILIPTNVLVTDKIKQKKGKKNEVIIEV